MKKAEREAIALANKDAIEHGLGHELRRQILHALRIHKVLSPNEYSKRADEPLTNVSYHFRQLAGGDTDRPRLIDLVETEPRRGALEHYYSLTELGQVAALHQDGLEVLLALKTDELNSLFASTVPGKEEDPASGSPSDAESVKNP